MNDQVEYTLSPADLIEVVIEAKIFCIFANHLFILFLADIFDRSCLAQTFNGRMIYDAFFMKTYKFLHFWMM